MHQAKVTYSDGAEGMFFSTDGREFYEHQLPDPHGATSPMRYTREFLKSCSQSSTIKAIEFMEVDG